MNSKTFSVCFATVVFVLFILYSATSVKASTSQKTGTVELTCLSLDGLTKTVYTGTKKSIFASGSTYVIEMPVYVINHPSHLCTAKIYK